MSAAVFSYAQAARGRAVSQPSPEETSSAAPSTTGSQGKDDASTGSTSVTAPSVASTSADNHDTEQMTQAQSEGGSPKQDSEAVSVGSSPSTAPAAEQLGKAAEEASAKSTDSRTQTQANSEGKASRSTSRTSRFNDNTDGKKPRKGKKSRSSSDKDAQSDQAQEEEPEKVKEPPKPVVLTEAAPPAVNPWAKRMEAQKAAVQAKVVSDGTAADSETKQTPAQEDAGTRGTTSNGVNGDKWAQKKSADATRPADQGPRRSGPRGSRPGDKDEKSPAALPLAADPSSWPDPKSAAEREQPARKTQEKTETTDKDSLDEAGPTRKKTWEKLEIVHSVVFETQLPPPRGSKPRNGAPRGGREGGSMRGSHPATTAANAQPASTSGNDKAPAPATAAGPKTAATARPREGSMPSRSMSHPQPSKRGSVDSGLRDQRKPSMAGNNTEQAREAGLETSFTSKRASATRDIRTENGPLGSEGAALNGNRTQPQERNNFQARGDFVKDGAHGQQYPSRDNRPERGRGGAYRARGGHNSSSSHLSSGSYGPNGHYGAPNGFQSRQNPNAHSPPAFNGQFPTSFGHPSRGRGNKWAGSGQPAGRNNAANGFPPKSAPVNDFAVGQYPPYMYSPVFDASVPILRSQVEYYLSVENLCKDYYLRQHMDGQGFVHLSTIAAFKRIKAVTEDVELLRLACSFSEQLEFGVADDGIERLRPRDKWQHFVLPSSERAEPYRNDGPMGWTPYPKADTQFAAPFPGPMVPQPYPPTAAGGFPGYPEEQMYAPSFVNGGPYEPVVNGGAVNGHHHGHESRLSAGVPEYAPPQSPVTLDSMTNFPDSLVDNLMMILSFDDEKDGSESSDAAGVAGYVSGARQASENGISANASEVHSSEPVDQADQSERGIVWVDAQASASTKAQQIRKPYAEIRGAALEQRQNAKAGDTPKEMQKLYKFWSQMLLRDFNAKVYQEFRQLALEDASAEAASNCGLKCLLDFYDRLLLKTNARKPWPQDRAVPEIFTAHLSDAVELDRKLGGKDAATI